MDWNRQEYAWYVLGCSSLQWSPLEEAEFARYYALYRQAHGFLKDADYRRAQASGIAKLLLKVRSASMIHRMRGLEQDLGFLATAVARGRSDDSGGQSIGVPIAPIPPGRSGQKAGPLLQSATV